jgi:hypothetical protein
MIMHTDDQPRDQPGVTPPPPDGLKRYIKPAAITALLVSLVTHIILLLIAAIITFSSARGGPSDAGETIELAVMTEEEFAALEDVALDSSATEVEELPLPDTPEIEMEMSAVEADLASEAASLEATIGGGNIGDGSVGISGSGDGSARFFGVEASGTRFAYIVDVSGSMDVSGKIDTLRLELNKSIDGLLESASFFIVLYNSGASPIGGKSDWVDATESGKRWARRHIAAIEAVGGTVPIGGFRMAFQRRPKPDAIYFMTDGEFDPGVEQEIARLNATYDVPIHCITFVSTQSEALMRRIAINSGGTYTHIAGPGG